MNSLQDRPYQSPRVTLRELAEDEIGNALDAIHEEVTTHLADLIGSDWREKVIRERMKLIEQQDGDE